MRARLPLIDSLRGFALLIMFAYHFAFDLDLFGAARIDFHATFWLAYRFLILALFLSLVGVSIGLWGRRWPDVLRLLRLAGGAALISLATRWMFPDAWVFFGILHFVLFASLVATPLARSPKTCAVLGLAVLGTWASVRSPHFDQGVAQLTGLGTSLPRTVDFVPVFPWIGVVLLGIFFGQLYRERPPSWLARGDRRLAFLGRHSLVLYLTHQGALLPLAWLVGRFTR